MKYSVSINRFDGGLNTKISPLQGPENESPDLQNVEFDDIGAVGSRFGYVNVNSAISGSLDLLHSYRRSNGPKLMAIHNGLYVISGSSAAIVTGSTGIFSPGVRVHACDCQNYLFLGNGSKEYKYNGSNFTRWGCTPAPALVASNVTQITATLSGITGSFDYAYRVAYINSMNVESIASDAFDYTASGTSSPVRIALTTAPASYGINYVSVYRNDYLLDTVVNGTQYVYDNHEILISPRDQTIVEARPPHINIFIYHKGYMFGAISGTNNLYYSDINTPESFDPSNLIRVGEGDGFSIKAMAIYNDGLVIAREDGSGQGNVFVLYMPDSEPDNWSLQQLDLSYGGVAPKAINRFGNFLMILNKNGVYDLSTVQMGVISSSPISFKIEPDILNMVSSLIKNSVAVVVNNKIWISICKYGSRNNIVYQYDYVRGIGDTNYGAWTKFTNMNFKDMCIHGSSLYASDYDGNIFIMNYGHDDNGSPIDGYYKTMHIYGKDKHRENVKVWREIHITVEASGDWNLTVQWQGGYSEGIDGTAYVDLTPGGAIWGTAVWGTSQWGVYTRQKTVKIPIHVVGKSIQIKVGTTGLDEYFKIYNIELRYSLRGVR